MRKLVGGVKTDAGVPVENDPGGLVEWPPRRAARVRVDVLAAGDRICLDKPVALADPDHAEPGRHVERVPPRLERRGGALLRGPDAVAAVEPPGGELGQPRCGDPGHVHPPVGKRTVRCLRAVHVDRVPHAQDRGPPYDRRAAVRRYVGRQRNHPWRGDPTVGLLAAGRAQLAGRERGDRGPCRYVGSVTWKVADVELDDRPADLDTVLIPVPLLAVGAGPGACGALTTALGRRWWSRSPRRRSAWRTGCPGRRGSG